MRLRSRWGVFGSHQTAGKSVARARMRRRSFSSTENQGISQSTQESPASARARDHLDTCRCPATDDAHPDSMAQRRGDRGHHRATTLRRPNRNARGGRRRDPHARGRRLVRSCHRPRLEPTWRGFSQGSDLEQAERSRPAQATQHSFIARSPRGGLADAKVGWPPIASWPGGTLWGHEA